MSLAAEARATGQNAVKCSKLAVVSVNYPKFVLLDCKCCCHNLLILNDTVTIKHDDICSAPVFTMLELLMRNPNKLLNDCSLLPSKINNRQAYSISFIHSSRIKHTIIRTFESLTFVLHVLQHSTCGKNIVLK